MTENIASDKLTPPPGFQYNPDILADYDEQVRSAIAEEAYQAEPIPSFEGVPTIDITPTFNPTGAQDSEIYARCRTAESLMPDTVSINELTDTRSIEMWRIVERSKLKDGTGLVSSRILHDNTLGNVEDLNVVKHLTSSHERRMNDKDTSTPFVSFSTDPRDLAKNVILRHGFGVKGGRDSVVVRVQVDPDRVITGTKDKEPEVLLLGGIAPSEYLAAYSVSDFISQLVPEEEITTVEGNVVGRDKILGHWAVNE